MLVEDAVKALKQSVGKARLSVSSVQAGDCLLHQCGAVCLALYSLSGTAV